ncbi:MAG TPA: hypothetical protein HPP50_03625 [Rhodospirillaceae bacterium]|nr:hypothetical protein [Rhodospirillaceae bacterium]
MSASVEGRRRRVNAHGVRSCRPKTGDWSISRLLDTGPLPLPRGEKPMVKSLRKTAVPAKLCTASPPIPIRRRNTGREAITNIRALLACLDGEGEYRCWST